jgi:phage FluMu protein Com
MPKIRLRVVRDPMAPPPWNAPPGAGPLFTGTGDTDYVCGNCEFVIAANIGQAQRIAAIETNCPCCGAVNEVTTEAK